MSENRTSTAAVLAAVAVGVWAVGLTVPAQGLGWLGEQVLIYYTGGRPAWVGPAVSLANAALVAAPAAVLALVPRAAAVRAAGRAWLAGAAALGLLGTVRAVPAAEAELHLALLAVGAGGLALALGRPGRREVAGGSGGASQVLFAAGGGFAMLLPWLWVGALGGLLETLLAVIAAAAVGWLAGAVLDQRFWARFRSSRPQLVLVGGLAAGVTLLLVAAGVGASGGQLPLLVTLPPLGFAAAALAAGGSRWPVRVLVGLATLGPLALADPEEVSLLLTTSRDVPFWVGVGTAGALAAAALLSLAYPFGLARPRPRWVGAVVAAAALVAAGGGYAGLGQPGLHGERLFVVLAGQADLSGLPAGGGQAGRDARAGEVYRRLVAHAEASQAGLRAELDRLGLAYTPYYLVNAVEVAGGPAVRAWLARRGEVDRVLRSLRLRPLPAAGGSLTGSSGLAPDRPGWNIELVGADQVWDQWGVTGEGVVVGTSDSGVDGAHPALAEGFRGGDDSWLDPWNGSTAPTDRNGHGTHTLGSAVGRDGIGVAPGAQWTGCANLDRGLGNPARYLDCLQFMLAPYPSGGDPWRDGRPDRAPHVLTNSWGCPPIEGCDETVLRPATAALVAAGIYPVVAAGNAGPFCETIQDPPAPYPDVLTVGAVDRDGELAAFSSRGPVPGETEKPDLVAPGAGVVSAVPGGGYRELDGTSMATPHVAGVVALMWSANPALIGDVATTTRILRETARPVTGDQPDCGDPAALTGAGLVDAHAAVQATRGE
ncbi:MAG: S8 family serine peptidase [Micromonosporaceae bacterium]|nr:S8 family serine peptidase [Micromonosporaceae bacterium]